MRWMMAAIIVRPVRPLGGQGGEQADDLIPQEKKLRPKTAAAGKWSNGEIHEAKNI